ncbi:MAG: YkgJ family cysteine cluster protein [Bacteroidales bacterium]|nr:YkgJ family cysteine cluster protein [Bacteroidales bacterium]
MKPEDLEKLKINAQKAEKENKEFFKKLKKKKPKNLDDIVHELDEDFFANFDCLTCANCCKSLGPRILNKDIERLAAHLKIKESDFIAKYLKIDEDKDYVFKTMPCPFLDSENYCIVYSQRPKACREYPHTSQKRFYQVLDETLLNISTCPAVYDIVEKLKKMPFSKY